jgi:AbiV family abortive infection protein
MGVRADVLLRGAWYAVEQSGLLLENAINLYSTKAYASAVLLALLAHEELGKCNILLDLWRNASGGADVSVEEVQRACDDHVEKQRQGQLSITYRSKNGGGFANLLQERSKAQAGTPEYAELDKQARKIDDLKAKRTPGERHSNRMRAMYVDLNDMGTDWSRPHLLPQEEATSCLTDAINDYSVKQDGLTQLDILRTSDPELATAISGWNDRPALPLLISIWREQLCV